MYAHACAYRYICTYVCINGWVRACIRNVEEKVALVYDQGFDFLPISSG